MSAFGAIVLADLRSGWNRLRRRGRGSRRLVLIAALLIFAGGPIVGLAFAAGAGLALMGSGLLEPLLAIGLALLATAILLFGLSTAVTSFYADRSLLLLASSPAGPVAIFFARLVSSAWANLALAALFAAAMAGFTLAAGLGPGFLLAALLLTLAIVVSATAVQVMALSLVLRVVPARLARDVANLITALLSAGIYFSTFGLRRSFTVSPGSGRELPGQTLTQLSSAGAGLEWLPTALPARALSTWAAFGPAAAAPWLAASLGGAAVLVGAALLSYRAAFAGGVGTYAEGTGFRPRRAVRRQEVALERSGPARPLAALVVKDWKTLRRDTRRLARALPSLLIAVGYPLYFGFFRDARTTSSYWGSLVAIWLAPFILSQMLGLTAVASEGRAFHLLRQTPLSMAAFLRSKLAFALPPTIGVSVFAGLLVSILSRQPPATVALTALGMAVLGAGMAAVAVSGGALSPDFEAADPRRAVGTVGSLVAIFGQLLFAGLVGGGAAAIGFGLALQRSWAFALVLLGLVLLAAAVAGVAVLALAAVERLRRWEG